MSIKEQMAMQAIHPRSQNEAAEAIAQPALDVRQVNQTRAYAQEVRSLRQRVAVLEAELAAAKAAEQLSKTPPLTSIDFAPASVTSVAPVTPAAPVLSRALIEDSQPQPASVFCDEVTPAVVSVLPTPPARPTPAPAEAIVPRSKPAAPATPTESDHQPTPAAGPAPRAGFAEAWNEEPDASFAEQVADKAFFEATSIDEQSRSWLLDS